MTINELTATSSVHAFNSGVESSKAQEQERAIKIAQGLIATACPCSKCETANKIMELIKASQND